MSKTIDERVVSMQFDNSRFEKNVATTMSTLDKLKSKLSFKGATKGLEDVNTAAKRVDMTGLGRSVEAVGTKFSALQVMGVTALANITNSAVNAGKRIVSALTIDPIKTGLSEYETKMNAVQVIQSNTRDKYANEAEQMKAITSALDELNDYADKTIYNFAQMTSNVGKFTAQGFDAKEAANAVKGLANLAAASGASAEDMARATYQMSQAMGSSIKLMDWNSLRNANMATQDLKNTLIALAKTHGIAIDQMIEDEGTFEYTLQNGWLTGEMFTEAMNIYSGVYSDAELAAKGFTDSQIENFKALAKNAESAATEVKTFSQLWDVLKETAQSGWTQTWELIFGDFYTSKKMFTQMQNYLSNIINGWSDARNFVLEGILQFTNPWSKIMDKLEGAGLGNIKKVAETVGNVTEKLEHFQDVVNKVWRGDYGNSDTGRFELLEKAGYDHRVVQDLVNKGYQYKLTMEDVEESHKKFGLTMDKTSESTKTVTGSIYDLTDAQLKKAGLTEEEIRLYRDVAKEAERTGVTFEELAKEMSEKDGRTLLMEGFANIGKSIVAVFKAMKEAWSEIFPPVSIARIYTLIKGFNEFTQKLSLTNKRTGELNKTGEDIKRTFKGVFAIIDVITTLVGGGFKIAFKLVQAVLKYFDLNILDVTASIGDALVAFRDWIDSILDFDKVVEKIIPPIQKALGAIKEWIAGFKETDNIPKYLLNGLVKGLSSAAGLVGKLFAGLGSVIWSGLSKVLEFFGVDTSKIVDWAKRIVTGIKTWFAKLKDVSGIAKDFVLGFINGIRDRAGDVLSAIWEFGKSLLTKLMNALDEHSPSKATEEIGKNFIQGFLNGLKDIVLTVFEFIRTFAHKCLDILRDIDLGTIFAGLTIGGGLFIGGKIASALAAIASPLEEFGDILQAFKKKIPKLMKSVTNVMNSFALNLKAQAIMTIAKAIAVLAAAVIVLSFIPAGKLWSAIGALAALAVIIGVLTLAADKMGKSPNANFGKLALAVIGISASLLIMSFALKNIESIDPKKALVVLVGFVAVVGAMLIMFKSYNKMLTWIGSQNMDKAGIMLFKMAGALLVLTIVAKMIAKMSWDDMGKAGAGLAGLTAIIAGLLAATKLAGPDIDKVGPTLFKLSAAMLILTIVAKIIAGMSWKEMGKAGAGLAGLGAIVAGLIWATKLAGSSLDGIGKTMLGIAAVMLTLALVAKLIAGMSWDKLAKGGAGLLALSAIIVGLIAATRLASGGDNLNHVGKTLLAVAGAIAILALVATLLGYVNPKKLWAGIGAVTVLAAIMAGLIAVTKFANDCKGNLVVLTVAIGVLAAAVIALSFIDPKQLTGATIALGSLMLVFSLLVYVAGKAQSSIGSLIVMTVAVGLLAGILYLLSTLETEPLIGSAIALSTLLLAVTGAFAILNIVNKFGSGSLKGVLLLAAMAVPLIAFVGVLAVMQNVQNALSNTLVLSLLATAMTALLIPLTLVGSLASSALMGVVALLAMAVPLIAFVGVLAVMQHVSDVMPNVLALVTLTTAMTVLMIPLTLIGALWPAALIGIGALTLMAVPLIAFVGVLAVMQNVDDVMPNVEALIKLMTTMTEILVILGIIGPLAIIGEAAMIGLTALIVAIGALVVGVGALVEKFPQLQSFIDTGLPLLERLAGGIGRMLGNFVGGIIDGVANSLPNLGTQLSLFMTNATPFIVGVKMVDGSVLEGVGILAACVLALTAADLIAGVASFIQGGSSFATLGTELSQFMINAMPFIAGASMLNADLISGVKALAETVLILTAANVLEGLTAWFTGGSSLTAFGEQLPALGTHLSQFATNLGTFGPDQIASVTCAAEAIKAIATAAESIPNSGGWLGKIVGENDIGTFGAQLGPLGANLSQFAANLGTFGEDQISTVDCAARAIKLISDAASGIPNEGGWLAKIVGDNNIGTFAKELPGLGTNLSLFATNLGTFGEDQITTVDCAARAIGAISKAAESIPNEGGWIAKLVGDNDIGTFGAKLPDLGEDLKGFADSVGTFGEGQIKSVNSAVKAIAAFSDLADCDLKAAQKNIGDFGDKLPGLGKDVASFASEMTKVSTSSVSSAATNLKTLATAIKNLDGVDKNAASNFSNAINTLGKTAIDKFAETFTSNASKTNIKSAAAELMNKAIEGFNSKLDAVKTAINVIVAKTTTTLKSETNYTSFYSAGSYLVDGFAAGISENDYKAEAKARAMAKAAAKAAEDALKINSPSKVGYSIGGFFGLGFVNAISDYADVSYNASRDMADSAHAGLSDAMNSASTAFNDALSSQPTIRPVVDLSAVRTGADAIGDMLDMGTSIGILSRVGSINAAINQRNQNGDNSDIVSELKKLGKKLDNVGSDTYTFGDFTYDDGSNVADAIKTLTRAAKMERRV